MSLYYDPSLKSVLPATNNSGSVVLNEHFVAWEDHIATNLRTREGEHFNYERGMDRIVLDACVEHARAYEQQKKGDITVMLTHPFYLHLSHMHLIKSEENKRVAMTYLNTLLGFLGSQKDNPQVTVAVLETIHHYASATSLLLEKGMVDRVIFTEYDSGYPLVDDELNDFKDDTVFFGGGYNGRCLRGSIDIMKERKEISSNVKDRLSLYQNFWAIKELVLNSLELGDTLTPSVVHGIAPSRVISLDEVIKKMRMGPSIH